MPSKDDLVETALKMVKKYKPDTLMDEYQVITSGQQAIVIKIADEFFKISHKGYTRLDIQYEMNAISFLHGKISYKTPKLSAIAPDYSFFSTKEIEGITLSQARLMGNVHINEQNFLDDIASLMLEIESSANVSVKGCPAFRRMSQMTEVITGSDMLSERNIVTVLGNDFYKKAQEVIRLYLHCEPWKTSEFVQHGDLSFDNIILDKKTGELVGIVDFGRIGFHPIEVDFTRFSTLGPTSLAYLVDKYNSRAKRRVEIERVITLRKARLFVGIYKKLLKGLPLDGDVDISQFLDLFEDKWIPYTII